MSNKKPAHKGPHKYKRILWGDKKTKIYRCMLPNCNHYKHVEFIEGTEFVCWKCGKTGIFTKEHVARDKVRPKCAECLGKRVDKGKWDVEIPGIADMDIDTLLENLNDD